MRVGKQQSWSVRKGEVGEVEEEEEVADIDKPDVTIATLNTQHSNQCL